MELELRKRGEVMNQHYQILPMKKVPIKILPIEECANKRCVNRNVPIENHYQILSSTAIPNFVVEVEAVEIREEFEERGRKLEAEIR